MKITNVRNVLLQVCPALGLIMFSEVFCERDAKKQKKSLLLTEQLASKLNEQQLSALLILRSWII